MQILKIHIILLLFVASSSGWAQVLQENVYSIDTMRQVHDLDPFVWLLVDSIKTIDDQIISGERDDKFIPLSAITKYNNQGSAYWLRIKLHANAPVNNWWLIIKTDARDYEYYSQWEIMEMYALDTLGNIVENQQSGINTPRSFRDIKEHIGFVAADISMPAHESRIVYIKLAGVFQQNVEGNISVELRNPALPLSQSPIENLLFILSAVTAILSILSFFFYIFVREKAYLFFFLYLLFLSTHYLILHPKIPFGNWFIPEHPNWILYFFVLLGPGGFILFFLFGRYFINLPSLSAQTDKWLMRFLALWAGILVLEIILMLMFQKSILVHYLFVMIFIAFGFLVRFAFFKDTLARFFVAGAAWLLFFSLLGIFLDEPLSKIGISPWPIGQVGQILIYLAGLAYKIRQSEHAKAEALRIREMDVIKSRFFANISHEFRTPLTLIIGVIQQIKDRTTSKQRNEDAIVVTDRQLNTMNRHADRLLELVNQLLDLSRLDSGKMKLQIIRGDVLQVLKTMSHAFDSVAERKQIHYHLHFPEKTQIAFFDQDKLEKIFTNLLSNAFKYTPERGTVSVNVDMEDGRLRMIVEDSGPGIAKKELDKIFDRFYQVEGTEDKGSGIGLALVKELTDLYGGQITVSSDEGKGTQFRISLPVTKNAFREDEIVYGEWKGEAKTIHNSSESEESVNQAAHSPDLPLMLVVEDNTDLRQFIRESMQSSCNVIEATNGSEGLQFAIDEIPDIIVSDVMMPGMDGFALTEKLKKDDRTSHIPVILLTAKAGQTHKLEGLSTGADEYLTKPFDVKELIVRAQNLINGRKLLRKKFAGQITLKPSEVSPSNPESEFLKRIMDAIEKNMHQEQFGVEELARTVAMSRSQLHRKMIALIDKAPSEVLRQTRLLRAKELLEKKSTSPAEVAYQVGFNSHSYFSKCFKEEFGMSPSEV
jgi:signal transduction histidine kinase/DNA-binding response OmpR family regulator